MNLFDNSIIRLLNGFANEFIVFDFALNYLQRNHLLKGGVMMALYWMVWFTRHERQEARARVLTSLFSCFVALFVARALALWLPFRLRPMHEPRLGFELPYSVEITALDGWSSFPSDHATLFCAMATGLCFISRSVGRFAFAYAIIVICLPRIYLGFHYPTDIIVGGLVGVFVAMAFQLAQMPHQLMTPVLNLEQKLPQAFYLAFFLFSYEMADMFIHVRGVGGVRELLTQLSESSVAATTNSLQ